MDFSVAGFADYGFYGLVLHLGLCVEALRVFAGFCFLEF